MAAAIAELGIVRAGQREVSDDTARVVRSDIQRRLARG